MAVNGAKTPRILVAYAGDTIVAILDVDPERDAPEWNARVAIGVFNNFFLLANGSGVGGVVDDANPSEALMMTVRTSGTYLVYVDGLTADAAGNTYNLSVSVIPATTRTCTTYAGATGAINDLATTDWGRMQIDLSDFAGVNTEIRFHLETDDTVQLAGVAIDDVSVTSCTIIDLIFKDGFE